MDMRKLKSLKVTHRDLEELFQIARPNEWTDHLAIREDGIWMRVHDDLPLVPSERVALSEGHPTDNPRSKAAHPLPTTLGALDKFLTDVNGPPFSALTLGAWAIDKSVGAPSGLGSATESYMSDKLMLLIQAARRFWENALPEDRGTHPINEKVAEWLVEHGLHASLAQRAATIIRPKWAGTGRKPGR